MCSSLSHSSSLLCTRFRHGAAMRTRLLNYHRHTDALVAWFPEMVRINGMQSPEAVFGDVCAHLGHCA